MVEAKTITIHMVSSLDGYVANDEGTADWMSSRHKYPAGKTLTDHDISTYLDGIDSYIIGAKTYQTALSLGWPYGDKPVYVLSTSIESSEIDSVSIWEGLPESLIQTIAAQQIWVAGGPKLVKSILSKQLANQLIITICPTILGSGRPFFEDLNLPVMLHGDFPSKSYLIEKYATMTGLDMSRMNWYEAFAYWKGAVIAQQLYARYMMGDSTDERMAKFGVTAGAFAKYGLSIL